MLVLALRLVNLQFDNLTSAITSARLSNPRKSHENFLRLKNLEKLFDL